MIDRALAAARRSPHLTIWYLFLVTLLAFGAVSGARVLIEGLRVTNLTDELPWGLWIVIDLSSIAPRARSPVGGSLRSAEAVRPIRARRCLSACSATLGDAGAVRRHRPDRFYHPILY